MTPKSLIAPARLARRPVLATQTDARLVDLVRAGYEPAFEAIVSRYRGALLRYAERFLSRERAEDAVQQSFVRAYEAMLRDDAELNLRPWLYRIAHNTALNALRDRGARHEALDESIDGVERPDQALERSQGLRDVLAAVQALPERQRDAIVLRELEGRSYEEIATELGVTGGSVRQLLNRARNTLRAGASALIPLDLVLRIPLAAQSEPLAARVAELCGAAGAGAALTTKVGATAAVTATLVGGAVVVPDRIQNDSNAPPAVAAERDRPERRAADPEPAPADPGAGEVREPARPAPERPVSAERDEGSGDRSGPGSGASGDDEGGDDRGNGHQRSNRGPGGDGADDGGGHRRRSGRHGNSGPGGGGDEDDRDDERDEDEDEAGKLVRDESDEEDNSGPGGGDDSGGGGGSGSGSGGDSGGDNSGPDSGDDEGGEALYESSGEPARSEGSGGSDGSGSSGGSGD